MVQTDVAEEGIASIFRVFNKNPRTRNQREQVVAVAHLLTSEMNNFVRICIETKPK
jgi:hypothetical protein